MQLTSTLVHLRIIPAAPINERDFGFGKVWRSQLPLAHILESSRNGREGRVMATGLLHLISG